MPVWTEYLRDIFTLAVPLGTAGIAGWLGLRARSKESRTRRETAAREAELTDRTVTTESWSKFVEQQQAWAKHQESVVARQNATINYMSERITAQDGQISELYEKVGSMRRALSIADGKAASLIAYFREWAAWMETAFKSADRIDISPPPVPPGNIADDVDDVVARWRAS